MRLLVADLRASSPQWTLNDHVAAAIRAGAPSGWRVHIVQAPTVSDGDGGSAPSAEALDAIAEAEAYTGFGISRPLFLAAPALRWVHSAAAGVGSLLFPELLASNVIVSNAAGVHGPPIAEHVVGGVLHFVRAFDLALALQARHEWTREAFAGEGSVVREISECRALIIGAGGLGGEIATRLSALGVRCTGIRRRPEAGVPAGFARIAGQDALSDLLGDADLLVITAPATSATQGLIGAAELDRLPPAAIVVNVARGSLLDSRALETRLRGGQLRGAVLDVFPQEPLPADDPLWTLPNVLITPHVSAVAPRGFWRRTLELLMDNWRRYNAGLEMRNVVDKREGY